MSWVNPALLAAQNADISLAATNDLFVATSFGTANTLALGNNRLTLTAGRNLTIDRGFTVNAFVMSFTVTSGTITLSGSSGVAAGLIAPAQLAALAPTSLQGLGLFITMNAGSGISLADATLGATMAQAGFLDLTTSAGGVTQSPAGTIIAREVFSSGGVVGMMSLPSTNNAIGLVDFITVTGGDLTVVSGQDLVIGGTLSANNLFFEVARPCGVLTLGFPGDGFDVPATMSAGSGGRIALVADTFVNTIAGSTLTTTGGSVELAPFSNINTSLYGSTGLIISSAFLTIVQTNGGTLDLGGYTNVPAGAVTPSASASSVTIDGAADLTAIAATLRLDATGSIAQPGGPITVGTIIANGGSVTLTDPGNAVSGVTGSATGAFAFTDATQLALGNIAAGSVETIVAPAITIPGTQQAPLLSLTANKGSISETGSLLVGQLTGSSAGSPGQDHGVI